MNLNLNYIRSLDKRILIIGGSFIGVMILVLTFIIVTMAQVDISKLEETLPRPLVIIDKNGEVVSEQSSANFTTVSLSEIPEDLIAAIIAVEDNRFYKHSGVDIIGIARSALANFRAGHVVAGGSTITQQLAKNLFYTSEQTYTRKIKEAITAIRIEARYSKDEILELYLNQIYFGEGTWGVQNAAQMYFGKDIQDVTLAEAALLAGLPKAPTHYSPFKNEEKSKERRNLILSLLYDQKYLDKDTYEKAVSEEIILRDGELNGLSGKYPSYIDYVIEEAIDKYGFSEEYLLKGDLQIYTQMDPVVQSAIEEVYETDSLFPESSGEEIVQSAAVVIDPSSGGIRGLIGYRGKYYADGFNRATQLKRQPGSAIKPLAVYAPALENGYKKNSILIDEKTDFDGYRPSNVDGRYRGRVTLYNALVNSINVPAVWLLNEMGVDVGIDFLKKSGIPLHEDDKNLSLALGGFTEGVSPLEMAQAFSMFPNLGTMNKAHAITKITTRSGEVLLEVEEESVNVMKPENAYTMTQMLMGVVDEGTGQNADLGQRPTAGKTGTTQLPSTEEFEGINGIRDAWFVGYTPELVTAVWIGYDKLDPNHVITSSGGNHPARIFRAIMSKALINKAISQFTKPKNFKEEGNKNMDNGSGKGKNKGKGKNND